MLLRLFQNGSGGRKVAGSSPVAPTLHPATQAVISFEIFMTKKWGG